MVLPHLAIAVSYQRLLPTASLFKHRSKGRYWGTPPNPVMGATLAPVTPDPYLPPSLNGPGQCGGRSKGANRPCLPGSQGCERFPGTEGQGNSREPVRCGARGATCQARL